jgi:hypothetical protein
VNQDTREAASSPLKRSGSKEPTKEAMTSMAEDRSALGPEAAPGPDEALGSEEPDEPDGAEAVLARDALDDGTTEARVLDTDGRASVGVVETANAMTA